MSGRKLFFLSCLFLLLSGAFTGTAQATKWLNSFVVWEGYQYNVQDEYIEETKIDSKLGK